MTLYGAYIGGSRGQAQDVDNWAGKPFDAFLAYTEGWDDNNWEGLRPIVVTKRGGALGDTRRYLLWSIMMITDNAGVGGYRSVAKGERRALHEQIGRDLIEYHNGLGDTTGPIYVRSTWEVPGEWFGWNVAATQDPEAFKGAWREFAAALHRVSPRLKTVWDFNSDRGEIEYLYPGDEACDVISQDIYWIHDLQGTDPVKAFHKSRHGYSRGLQWHLEWCRAKRKPMAIAEYGIKLNGIDESRLDCTTWFKEFFKFIDEVNADPNVGMAFVTWWNSDDANTGHFVGRVRDPHLGNVRNLFRERLPGTVLGGGGAGVTPPVQPPTPTEPATITHGTGADKLVLKISQQPYDGPAQYRVLLDGQPFGPTFTASAQRSAGQSDTLTLKADLAPGAHQVRVEFLNDKYGGTGKDRNLYLDGAALNDVAIPDARKDILGPADAAAFTVTKGGGGGGVQPPIQPPPGGDWEAEAKRLAAENKKLHEQISNAIAAVDVLRGMKS